MYREIKKYIALLEEEQISVSRRTKLQPLIDFIRKKRSNNEMIRVNFICTHNSRRSHLAQIWMQTLAHYYVLDGILCYSGGTESTAVFPVIIDTMEEIGFKIEKLDQTKNAIYGVKFADNEVPVLAFSKEYDHFFNPVSDFAAVMTCEQADAECPLVHGAENRIPIPYDDPKIYDDTPVQKEKYLERSTQIAAELAYVVRQVMEN